MSRDPVGEWGGENPYHYVFNMSVNLVDFLGLACCEDVDCGALQDSIDRLTELAEQALNDLGDVNSMFDESLLMANLSLSQSGVNAFLVGAGLLKSLAENAAKTSPKVFEAAGSYVATQGFDDAGKAVHPGKIAELISKSNAARNAGAIGVAGKIAAREAGRAGAKGLLGKIAKGLGWFFDPAGTAGKDLTELGSSLSSDIYQGTRDLQRACRDLQGSYDECCP